MTAVLTLALGIGANTTIFSVVNAVLLRPLPFANANQLVVIHGKTNQVARMGISYPDLEDWRKENQSFEGISTWMGQSVNLTGRERPERVRGGFVSANFFELLGVAPIRGRGFSRGEDEPGAAPVAVVNYSLWQNRFGGDPDFVGKQVTLNGVVFTVGGILPKGFEFPLDRDRIEIWLPVTSYPDFSRDRKDARLIGIARMKSGVTLQQAQTEMDTIAARLAREYPDAEGQRGLVVRGLQDVIADNLRPLFLVLLGAVGFVLLIACANVVNLLLARGAARAQEISLRATLGASRTRLVRQILTETTMLWLAGGALGVLVSMASLGVVLKAAPVELPPGIVVGLDGGVLLFAFAITSCAGILAGLGPALQFSRNDLDKSLKQGGGTAGDGLGPARLRAALLVAQVALSMVLLVGSGLMIQTIVRLSGINPGFDPKNVLTLEYRLPQTEYADPHEQINFHERVRERVRQIPGVKSASVSIGVPFSGNIGTEPLVLLDRPEVPPGQEPVAETNVVDKDYFATLRIPLVVGRLFAEGDVLETMRVAIINQTMAQKYWPGRDPIGRQLELLDEKKPMTIVGVVGDVKESGLDEKPATELYVAYKQNPDRFATLAVRTESEPMGFANAVRQAVWSMNKDQAMWKVRSLESMREHSVGDRRYLAWLLSGYAGLALLLAAVGIYGVLSYSVKRRTREIGVRMVLGAQPRETLGMIVGEGMKKVGAGIAAGLVGAILVTRIMSGLLYGVGATDPMTMAIVATVLACAGLLACWIPARQAMRVDPVIVLRHE